MTARFLALAVLLFQPLAAQTTLGTHNTAVYFSPNGGCTAAIVKAIDEAKTSIRVQAYGFTSRPILDALVNARRRGVDVQVILDKSNRTARFSLLDALLQAGIPVFIDRCSGIAHCKVMVIDKAVVITGSFNFTQAAEQRNVENVLVIRDSALAGIYTQAWEKRRQNAE